MPRKRQVVKIVRAGRIVEIPRWVYEYNQRKRVERHRNKIDNTGATGPLKVRRGS